jgi:hypothetical protein
MTMRVASPNKQHECAGQICQSCKLRTPGLYALHSSLCGFSFLSIIFESLHTTLDTSQPPSGAPSLSLHEARMQACSISERKAVQSAAAIRCMPAQVGKASPCQSGDLEESANLDA